MFVSCLSRARIGVQARVAVCWAFHLDDRWSTQLRRCRESEDGSFSGYEGCQERTKGAPVGLWGRG